MAWAGWDMETVAVMASPAFLFLEHFGYELDSPLSLVGALGKEDYDQEVLEIMVRKPDDTMGRLNAASRTRARKTGHAARVWCGTEYTVEDQAK